MFEENTETSVSDSSGQKPKMSGKKKAAIVLGSVAAATAITVGVIYAKKHMNTPTSDILPASKSVRKFAESMAKEPIGIVHSSRGKNGGYTFPQRGGLDNPGEEMIKAGLDRMKVGEFKRYGERSEKVAARYLDPEGRKDFSGRLIGHDVVLPESMAKNVSNLSDVEAMTWPLIKDVYQVLWDKSQN